AGRLAVSRVVTALPWLVVALAVLLVWRADGRPAVVGAAAPASVFSAERAAAHLERLAAAPRPIGAPQHDRAERYIVATLEQLDFKVDIQDTVASAAASPRDITVAHVRNIVARRPGSEPGGALLVAAHYDSVPTGPGAGDDAAAV